MHLAALLAILPVVLLLFYIYRMDSYEKEPAGLLVTLVICGILSAIPAILLEELGTSVLVGIFGEQNPLLPPPPLYNFINTFFIVAISEELVKFLAAYFLTWKHPAFNFKFDGIVYCFYSSMGFALIENILYVFARSGGASVGTAVSRALLAIPAHGMFSVFMGYYYGEAKFCNVTGDKKGVKANLARGFIIAILLHGFYDFCLFSQKMIFIIGFFAFIIAADIYTIIKISKASKANLAIYNTPQYQPYWVTPPAGSYPNMMNPMYAAPQGYAQAPQGYGAQGYAPNGQPMPPQGFAPNGQPMPPQGFAPNGQPMPPQGYAQNSQGMAPQGYAPNGPDMTAQGYAPNVQGYDNQGYNAPQDNYNSAPQGYTPNAQGMAPQDYGTAPIQGTEPYQDIMGQAVFGQAGDYNSQLPVAEQHTSILRREAPRMIYCPNCHNVCNFNSFFCGKCSTPLHNFGAAGAAV